MKIKTLTSLAMTSALGLITITTQATAAGRIEPQQIEPIVIPASPLSWYAGVEGGTLSSDTFTNGNLARSACDSFSPSSSEYVCGTNETYNLDGNTLGLFVGFNASKGSVIWGGELRAMTISGADQTIDGNPNYTGRTDVGISLENLQDLRGRVGTQINDDVMIYGALGVSRLSLDAKFCYLTQGCASSSYSETGTNFGVGMEYNLGVSSFIGADYTARTFDFSGTDISADTFNVRLGYRF